MDLTCFVLFGLAYLITSIIYIVIRNVWKDCKCLKVVWLVDIAYFIAGILYYVGRNVPIPVVQPILLGMVVLIYRFIPFFISKYYQSNLAKDHQTTEAKLQLVPEWILAAESLTLLVDFDAMYIVMFRSFIQCTVAVCTSSVVIAACVLWALFVLLYTIVVYYTMNVQYYRNCNVNISCVASNLGAIVALAAFGMYLLDIPLRCDATINLLFARIGLKVLVLMVVITVIILLLEYRCLSKTRQEKLLPRALYQHLHPEPDEQPLEFITNGEEEFLSP